MIEMLLHDPLVARHKDQDYGIRISEERTALTDKTIEARNVVAAFEPGEMQGSTVHLFLLAHGSMRFLTHRLRG